MRAFVAILLAMLGALASPGAADAPPGDLARLIADAAPGATVVVPAGNYRGVVRIDKPLRLVGEGRPVIDGHGSGDIIEIAAEGVEIRGFLLRNTGIDLDKENCAIRVLAGGAVIEDNVLEDVLFGIDLKEAPNCIIRNNRIGAKALDIARRGDTIRLYRANGTLIEGNITEDGRDAILWYSSNVMVRGNIARRCRYGFHLMYSDSVTLENNELTDNSVGVYFMYSNKLTLRNNRIFRNRGPSGYGVGLKETDEYTLEGNVLAGNRVGIYIDGSPFRTRGSGIIRGNTIASNDAGMAFLPQSKGNRVWENSFIDNIEQVAVLGRGELKDNDFDVDEVGNYWTDYAGYDGDGDGVGEIEHESAKFFESLLDREPKLRILLFSPAHQAIEFVGRAVPAVRPEPKFTDYWPLTEPRAVVAVAPAAGVRARLLGVGAALLIVAAGLGWVSFGGELGERVRARRGGRRNAGGNGT